MQYEIRATINEPRDVRKLHKLKQAFVDTNWMLARVTFNKNPDSDFLVGFHYLSGACTLHDATQTADQFVRYLKKKGFTVRTIETLMLIENRETA